MKKVLIIDDEQSYLIKITYILEKFIDDCEVTSAKSGLEGIEIAKKEQPDTILLDVVMPEMDGYEVCKVLKTDPVTKSIPIILASAFQKDTNSRVLGLESGADVFLSKPFDPTELSAQVSSMIRIRKAENTIKESNEKFRTVADYAYDWEYWINAEGNLVYISPSCERITGYTMSEFIEDPLLLTNIVHRDDVEKIERHKANITSTGECKPLEFRINAKNGDVIWIGHVCQRVFDVDGNNIGIRASNREITKRKLAEAKITRQTEELSLRNEELDAFAHTVAHDLRTPIGSIIGFADILKENDSNISADEANEFLSNIATSGRKTLQILNSLLLLSEVRKIAVPKASLDINMIVTETVNRLSTLISDSNAKLTYPSSWPKSVGYAIWVEEIFVNYISNAIKFGGDSPVISIGSDIIKSDNGDMVRYWVQDNGYGISAEDQKLLFRQFERLKQAKIKGHGLGLSIVRRIAEKLGGSVGVESELGKGSLFYFILPANS